MRTKCSEVRSAEGHFGRPGTGQLGVPVGAKRRLERPASPAAPGCSKKKGRLFAVGLYAFVRRFIAD